MTNISSFSQFLVEEEQTVYFTFGRMNPPTIGHGKLLEKLSSSARRHDYKVFLSQSHDSKKNPLEYTDKVKHVRKMFPKHARNIMINKNVRTAIEAAVELYNQGYRRLVMVVGSDRVNEFETLLNKYNGQKARHGFYNFASIKVISAGERDPDAEGVEGMSASKMRSFAVDRDFTSFAQGVPSSMSDRDTKKLFNDVRRGLGLKEASEFTRHIELQPVSSIREQYVAGEIFLEGDDVIVKQTNQVMKIATRGPNYVIVEGNGQRLRKWLDDIELIEQSNTCDLVSRKHIQAFEKFVDRMFEKYKIDFEFTRHFGERLGDDRNDPCIKMAEVASLIKKIYAKQGRPLKSQKNAEVVIKDMQSDLNMPIVVKYDPRNDEFDVVAKTIMRKKNFKTPNKIVRYEQKHTDRLYKDQPEWGTPQSTKKAKKITPGQTVSEQDILTTRDNMQSEREKMKERQRQEREQLKQKHNRIIDKARRRRMIKVNRGMDQ